MKKLASLILLLTAFKFVAFSMVHDSVDQKSPVVYNTIDSLNQELRKITSDTLRAGIYAQIARQYLNYDTISNKKTKINYQNKALDYTMLALHGYSKYNDTLGLRTCFNSLSRVYRSQKKYSQAKWFVLQSNAISRTLHDVPGIIISLTELANIKMEIKDYTLAKKDLNEALKLSADHHNPRAESIVQQSYALLYSHLKDYDKEAIAMKRHNFIEDSIRKGEESQLIAKLNAQDTIQRKKKYNTISYKKVYKTSSSKRIASI